MNIPKTILPVKITENAAEKVREIMAAKEVGEEYGLRIGKAGGGCGGMSFILGFDTKKSNDDIYESEGVQVFIDKADMMYLVGLTVDYVVREDEEGFTFVKNP